MKKILGAILNFFNHWILAMIIVSSLVTLITWIIGLPNFYIIGMLTFAGMGILNVAFVWGRQLYWWITSSGDYEKDKKQN